MIDIQNKLDYRRLDIKKVGVKDIKYPIVVYDKYNKFQPTVARFNMYVNLPHHFKGTHMSRFIEVLNAYRGMINPKTLFSMMDEMKRKLKAESAHLELEFPYFIEKQAPVTKEKSMMEYTCRFLAESDSKKVLFVELDVPITTLCPCSKNMCEHGAHNQRGRITVRLKYNKFFWIEDVIEIIENSASCEIYSLLKRPDEKFVTEKAYNNPMFVEDIVRNVAINLNTIEEVTWQYIEAENFESIHNHSAYALVENNNSVSE
ncbi:MAG: GTP cyclohydrolase FolE2 [Thermodesulfobacteriota bacterium]|nr:GTP cyclohydrolase FolE2 [Thermodesulfobacteriota bacterium]